MRIHGLRGLASLISPRYGNPIRPRCRMNMLKFHELLPDVRHVNKLTRGHPSG